LDAVTCPQLEECLNGLIDKGESSIILDLDGVPYVSSAGLRILLMASQKLRGTGKLALSRLRENVLEVFEITGFTNIMEIHNDLESAKISVPER
jgi:anti-anti-sigma factor